MIEFLLLVLLVIGAHGLGAPILELLGLSHISKMIFFLISLGLGFGVMAALVFVLGLIGLLYAEVAYIAVTLALIVSLIRIKKYVQMYFKTKKTGSGWELSGFMVIIILVLIGHIVANFMADLDPPTNGDTLMGYLAVPKIWINNHRLVEIPYLGFSYLPSNIQLLSTLGMLLKNDILSQLISGFLMGILAAAVVYAAAKEFFSREVGVVAAAIFYATPVVSWLSHSAKVDLGWLFFELLAIYCFVNFLKAKGNMSLKWALLSGIFCGLSAGTKYSVFSSVIITFVMIIKVVIIDGGKYGEKLRILVFFLIPVLLMASPWYIKNYVSTGNPLYPMFTGMGFGDKSGNYGSGIFGYLTFFWPMSLTRMSKGMSMPAGPVFLAFVPCVFLMGKINPKIKFILLYCFVFSLLWYSQVRYTRHFLPALALLSVVAAYSVCCMRGHKGILRKFVSLILFVMLSSNFVASLDNIGLKGLFFVLGGESRDKFLSRVFAKEKCTTHANYEMIKYMNTQTDKHARILAFGHPHAYYIERDYIGLYLCNEDYLGGINIYKESDVHKTFLALKKKKFTHVFLNPFVAVKTKNGYSWKILNTEKNPFVAFRKAFGDIPLFTDESKERYLRTVFSCHGQYLYKILD
jgi:hypothetical protein